MSKEDRAIMSECFGRTPFRIDSKGIRLCARPRLYWITWECQEGEGVSWEPGEFEGWENFDSYRLEGQVDSKVCCYQDGVY